MEQNNYKKVKKVLWIIFFMNIAVALLKVIIGSMIKSSGLTADGFHSLTDGTSNIIGLIGIWLAARPVDNDHPYGHGKFETLTGLFISCLLLFISLKIVIDAVKRFVDPVMPVITLESLIALILTLFVNIFVSIYEYRVGKKLNSHILVSDSMHTRSDVFISAGVLVSLVGIRLGLPAVLDPAVSLIVSGFIFYAAYEIFKDSRDILVDKVAVDVDRIRDITLSFDEVKDIHDIRSRGSENAVYIDMHIMTEPHMSVEDSHILIHKIEDKIREEISSNIQVIAHIEPYE